MRKIAALGGDLIDGVGDLVKANRKVDNLACPIGNSFVPGTRVVMADGATRPIEEVDVGEKVLATDPETGEQTSRTVLATIIGSGSKHLVEITVDPTTEREAAGGETGSEAEGEQAEQTEIPGPVASGDVIIATDEHPFRVPDLGTWVDAIDLAPGTWLQTSAGTWVQVSAVQAWTQAATVHNLTVQGVHTFHVTAGDLDVLNHNCGGARFSTDSDGKTTDLSNSASTERNPLQGTRYTRKVQDQIQLGDDHGFPATIDTLPTMEDTSFVAGGDGVSRLHVKLPGSVNGKRGTFHWIVGPNMSVNHRFFGKRMK